MTEPAPPRREAESVGPCLDEARRWSIWIDIEGFGTLWREGRAVHGLRALMSGIFAIGTRMYTGDGERLFAHQFGDGFVIVADFHEPDLDRCAAIAIALIRHVAKSGCMARAAIAEGEFADISGLWRREIRDGELRDGSDDIVALGSGLMTLLPVMGTALINANKLDSRNPMKGALLTIATDDARRISVSFPRQMVPGASELTVIDWVHAGSPVLDAIAATSGIGWPGVDEVEEAVRRYFRSTPRPSSHWIDGTSVACGMS